MDRLLESTLRRLPQFVWPGPCRRGTSRFPEAEKHIDAARLPPGRVGACSSRCNGAGLQRSPRARRSRRGAGAGPGRRAAAAAARTGDVACRAGQGLRQPVLRRQTELSAWAITTSQGIILLDAIYDYSVEDEVVDGLKKLGLDPADIKYVIVSHGHLDHAGGAKYLQEKSARG